MSGNELITLQFGTYANFVGCHFWNLQDKSLAKGSGENLLVAQALHSCSEITKDVYRYTPRVLSVDLSGSTGDVSLFGNDRRGAEDLAAAAAGTWSGGVEVHEHEALPQSQFAELVARRRGQDTGGYRRDSGRDPYDDDGNGASLGEEDEEWDELESDEEAEEAAGELSKEAKLWVDYNEVMSYASTSLLTLPGCWASVSDWSAFGDGRAAGPATVQEVLEGVRRLAEDCDRMQGFQIMAEDIGGFGILLQDVLPELASDYETQPSILYSVRRPGSEEDLLQGGKNGDNFGWIRSALNEAMCMALLPQCVSLYAPLSVPQAANERPESDAWPGIIGVSEGSAPAASREAPPLPPPSLYESSAALALAVDNLCAPLRLSGLRSASGPEVTGALDLRSTCQLMSAAGGANLMATKLRVGLPPCNLAVSPSSRENRTLEFEDPATLLGKTETICTPQFLLGMDSESRTRRVKARRSSDGGREGAGADDSATPRPLAELYSFRGVSNSGSGLTIPVDALSLAFRRNAMAASVIRHGFFQRSRVDLSRTFPSEALVVRRWAEGSGGAAHVPRALAASTATSLFSTASFGDPAAALATGFRRAAGSAIGRAKMADWGFGGAEQDEVRETLLNVREKYNS